MKNEIKVKWTEASKKLPPKGKIVLMETNNNIDGKPDYIVGSIDNEGDISVPFVGWFGFAYDIVRWVAIEDLAKEADK